MYIDLHPMTNTSPYTMVETMSLAKAQILFRELGLETNVCGIKESRSKYPPPGFYSTQTRLHPEHILGLYPKIKGYK